MIRFCGIITLGPTFQKNFFVPGFLKRPAKPEETRRFSHKETGRHRRYRSAGFRDCVRKESRRHRRGYQRKDNQKVERRTPELEPQSQTQDYAQEETENHLPSRTISASKAYVARIARSVVRRNEETKCFTQTLLNGTSSTNSWEFKSALAGLTQGTSTTTGVGARIALVAIEYFVKIAPAVASVGGEGSMCRMVFYHNKAAAGAVPDVAQIFDTNNFYSGRNVNYATKFSLLDDITHQMVITSYNSSSGVAFSAGPALFKIIR